MSILSIRFVCMAVMAAVLLSASTSNAQTASGYDVYNESLEFKFKLPQGFVELGLPKNDQSKMVGKYLKEVDVNCVIQIQRLGGRLDPNNRLSLEGYKDLPGVSTTVETGIWNGKTIDITRKTTNDYVVYAVQFPMPGEAIQLEYGGPVHKDADLKTTFDKIVASFAHHRSIKDSNVRPASALEPDNANTFSGEVNGDSAVVESKSNDGLPGGVLAGVLLGLIVIGGLVFFKLRRN